MFVFLEHILPYTYILATHHGDRVPVYDIRTIYAFIFRLLNTVNQQARFCAGCRVAVDLVNSCLPSKRLLVEPELSST